VIATVWWKCLTTGQNGAGSDSEEASDTGMLGAYDLPMGSEILIGRIKVIGNHFIALNAA